MYADVVTGSMQRAIDETKRRRKKQDDYNKANGIVPVTIKKEIRDVLDIAIKEEKTKDGKAKKLSKKELETTVERLTAQMKDAAKRLDFELAAALRDKIIALKGGKQ